ncbi:hypothetical protein V9N52_001696 [Vibrio navarrensis]
MLLIGSDAGESRLGAAYSLSMDDLTNKTTLYQTTGGHEPYTDERYYNGGLVWNPVDQKFWGIVRSHDPSAGKLLSFDPETDTLTYEATLSEEYISGSRFYASSWETTPVISADGKSMIAVAQNGGRESLATSIPGAGDGVVVHINLDKTDTTGFGKMTIVYEMYSGGNGGVGEFRNVLNNPVLGRYPSNTGKDALLLLSGGERWADTSSDPIVYHEKKAQVFILTPTDNSDWSQPWEVATQQDLVDSSTFALNQTSVNAFYDSTATRIDGSGTGRFVWSVRNIHDGDIFVRSDDAKFLPQIITDTTTECFYNGGLYHIGSEYFQFCSGFDRTKNDTYYNSVPRLLKISASDAPTSVVAFSNWKNIKGSDFYNLAPVESASDKDSGSLIITAVTLSGSEFLRGSLVALKDLAFYPARVEEIKPATGERSVLFEGNADYGQHFVGKPAIGGSNNQYIMQSTIGEEESIPGYLVKYNRNTGNTTKVRLGATGPAYFESQPLVTDAGVLFSTQVRTQKQGMGFVKMSKDGSAVKEFSMSPIINRHGDHIYAGIPLNFTTLENGEIWSVSKDVGTQKHDVFVNFDPVTLAVTSKSYLSDFIMSGSSALNFIDGSKTRFTSTAKGNILVYPSISIIGNKPYVAVNCTPLLGNPHAIQSYVLAEYQKSQSGPTVVTGPTLYSDGNLYVATTGGIDTILKLDIGDCTSAPVATTVAVDLVAFGSLPSTRFLSASDSKLYFGTHDGFLAYFNPGDNSLVKAMDLSDSDPATNSRVIGYLSEPEDGYVYGVVADTLISNGNPVTRRVFKYDIATKSLSSTVDVSNVFEDAERYPGVTKLH